MSIAPHRLAADGGVPAYEPGGPSGPPVTSVEVLRLQPGDRLLVHADGALGLGGGAAHKIAQQLSALLRLDELGFDVPVCVSAPGLRVEVIRPA